MRLHFWGATQTVTGSKLLVEHGSQRILVDAGLFQGLKPLRLRNREPLPLPASQIDAVVLTHAHLDHSGYLPLLVKNGFQGRIHCTPATRDLCGLLLPDSAHLMEEEALFANRHGYSRHHPALPLYTQDDVRRCMRHFQVHEWGERFQATPGVEASLSSAGHLLGASSALLALGSVDRGQRPHRLLVSGDLGRSDDLLMRPPEPPPEADTIVVESTYGDRRHPPQDVLGELEAVVRRTAERGGMLIVPAFAVGRAQLLLLALSRLKRAGRLPELPIFLNSPMAAGATRLYQQHVGSHRLSDAEAREAFGVATIVEDVEDSKRLNGLRFPSIIISASGMATGGRVLHHLKAYAPNARNTLLFAGYQAIGTRGANIVAGAETVKMLGEWVPIRAEVVNLDGLSAHADSEGLLQWLSSSPQPPQQVFLVHGEEAAAQALQQSIAQRLGWRAVVPPHLSQHSLASAAA